MALSSKQAALSGFFILASAPPLSVAAATIVNSASAQTVMAAADFSVTLNQQRFSLGDKWDDQAKQRAGAQISESFVGDVPSGESNYKYYQHSYAGYEIYTANLFWEKEQRDIDSYIIAQITLNAPGIATFRGVSVGDTQSELVKKYGNGTIDDSDNQHWIYYDGDGKRISFQIENNKVSHIMMVFNTD
ncbi:hypothetical protein N5923_08895 [Erwiniaceae bacterium BAC15a-03b]|uniref:Uncharacterized protein n=1 Tax=Winslowiella arboricola TaxID=2978220 RepID=A0A9J6PU95_9GAMM|nr:hypothetical protein [Winslowiella arboricola]MCU5771722.1 hypothetical protein [Winslowiella arboricola]MCU5777607.1 hypothetical protein [Winslowiella arboricola]